MSRQPLIVVLEDERAQLVTIEATLDGMGEIQGFQAPERALEYLRSRKADVAIIDVHIDEEMDGIDFIRAVRGFDPDVSVIVRTGDDSSELADATVAVGAFRRAIKDRVSIDEMREYTEDAIAETARRRKITNEAALSVDSRSALLENIGERTEAESAAEYYRALLHGMRDDLTASAAIADVMLGAAKRGDLTELSEFTQQNKRLASRLLAEMSAFLDGPFSQLGSKLEGQSATTVNAILGHIERRTRCDTRWVSGAKKLTVRPLVTDLYMQVHPLRFLGALRTIADFFGQRIGPGGEVVVHAEYGDATGALLPPAARVLVDGQPAARYRGWIAVSVSSVVPGGTVSDLEAEFRRVPDRPTGDELHLVSILLGDQPAIVALGARRANELVCAIATPVRW